MLPHDEVHKQGGEDPKQRERTISLAHLSQDELLSGGKVVDPVTLKFGSTSPQVPGNRSQWLSGQWAHKGNGIIGPHEVDNSLRCQRSRLCEGLESCKIGRPHQLRFAGPELSLCSASYNGIHSSNHLWLSLTKASQSNCCVRAHPVCLQHQAMLDFNSCPITM